MMTKKDFQLIADVVCTMPYSTREEWDAKRAMAFRFADRLAETSPRFDRDRFVRACWMG